MSTVTAYSTRSRGLSRESSCGKRLIVDDPWQRGFQKSSTPPGSPYPRGVFVSCSARRWIAGKDAARRAAPLPAEFVRVDVTLLKRVVDRAGIDASVFF